jgi:hypothetical protein
LIPYHFVGQSRVLEAPQGWDHDRDGECIGLPVLIEHQGGVVAFKSVWVPTPEQLAQLNGGGAVLLTCLGGQFPVMLDTLSGDCLLVPA